MFQISGKSEKFIEKSGMLHFRLYVLLEQGFAIRIKSEKWRFSIGTRRKILNFFNPYSIRIRPSSRKLNLRLFNETLNLENIP